MKYNSVTSKLVGLGLCCLSLAGCLGGKKQKKEMPDSAFYETQQADMEKEKTFKNRTLPQFSKHTVCYFDLNSYRLNTQAKESLQSISQSLKQSPDTHVTLEGHADAQGPDEFNEWLSKKRADSVKSYLISQKVDEERLDTYGYSNRKLAISGKSESAHAKNRRVELKLT